MSVSLGERIKSIRLRRGLTQEIFARKIGTNKSVVSKWERNITTPTPVYLKKVAELAEISIEQLASELKEIHIISNMDNVEPVTYIGAIPLDQILLSNVPLMYKGKKLSVKEVEKLKIMLRTLFE